MPRLEIVRNKPAYMSAARFAQAVDLLSESGLITRRSVESRIKRAFIVLLALKDGVAQATLSVKNPTKEYIADVFRRANVKHNNESVELGYLYAKRGAAGLWSGSKLGKKALAVCKTLGVSMFAVTRSDNVTMTRYLTRLGAKGSAPFKSAVGNHSLILWTATKQEPIVAPTLPTPPPVVSTTTPEFVSFSGYGIRSGRFYGSQFAGRNVIVTISAV